MLCQIGNPTNTIEVGAVAVEISGHHHLIGYGCLELDNVSQTRIGIRICLMSVLESFDDAFDILNGCSHRRYKLAIPVDSDKSAIV